MAKKSKTPTTTGNPPGRPSKYHEAFCEMLVSHMQEGYSFDSFGAIVGVVPDTLYEWVKQHPEFSEAKRMGKVHERYYWETQLRNVSKGTADKIERTVTKYDGQGRATGALRTEEPARPNGVTVIFALKNKFPKDWRDKKEIDLTQNDKPLESYSHEELQAKKRALEERLGILKKKKKAKK